MGSEWNKVEVKLTVDGTECFVVSMRLEQGFNRHHTFECVVDYEALDSKWMKSPGKLFQMLGKDATIAMKHKDGSGENRFTGTVKNISYIGCHGAQNHIRISGCSPTIKLDGSKTMDSFMDMTLSGIVSEAVSNSGNGGKITSQPKFTGKIDYISQYEETCFEFLNRLSWIYGEWFFYDGQDCYFGKQEGQQETVTFESEITTLDLSANLIPSKLKHYHYLVHDDRETDFQAPKPETVGYHKVAQNRSDAIYSSDATLPSKAVVLDDGELEKIAKAEKIMATAEMFTVSGTSQTSKVKIGGKALIKLPKYMEVKEDIDTFTIISVVHEYEHNGKYRNTFSGISSTSENIPVPPVCFPKAFSQIATVKTNDDTKKLGRVKVEFQWQKAKSKTTNWIRVQTPDAGKSDIVPKNRGFVFIPEKDDIVMIDFEYGDPNRPYVAGSIFSEKVSEGGKENNKIKSITTRSGSTITFDDEKGSILIKDQKGSESTITFDGETNIAVKADTSISLTSGKANITLMSEGDGTITMKAKTFLLDAGETFKLDSGKLIAMDSKDTFNATSTKTSTLNSSMETTVSGQIKTTVTAVGQTIIDGAIVKIN